MVNPPEALELHTGHCRAVLATACTGSTNCDHFPPGHLYIWMQLFSSNFFNYPGAKTTVEVGSVVVAEDHFEAFLRHSFDRQIGWVWPVGPQLNHILVPENMISQYFSFFLRSFQLVHEVNVVRVGKLVAPDCHLRRGLLQRLGSIFHWETRSCEEVIPEIHEVL